MQEMLTNAIMRWIATNSQPISIVDVVRVRNIFGLQQMTSMSLTECRMQELNEKDKDYKSMALQSE